MYGSMVGRQLRKSSIVRGSEEEDDHREEEEEEASGTSRHLALALANINERQRTASHHLRAASATGIKHLSPMEATVDGVDNATSEPDIPQMSRPNP